MVGGDGPGMMPTEEEANVVTNGPMAGELQGEPDKTLQDARFVIGELHFMRHLCSVTEWICRPAAHNEYGWKGGRARDG